MSRRKAAGESLRAWYLEIRLVDQLLLLEHLQPAERSELLREPDEVAPAVASGTEGSTFMEVKALPSRAGRVAGSGGSTGGGASRGGSGEGGGLGGGFAALDGLEDETLSKWQRKQRKRKEQAEHEESIEADEMEQQLAKAHSLDTASKAVNRAPAKHPRYSSAQIEEMTVRQLKRALEERGEGFDLAWVGRPDERQLLQEHATSLRTMCTDASFGPDADSVDEFARFRDLQAISEPDAGSLESWGGHPRRFREPHRSTSASDVPPSAPGHRVAGSPQGPGQRPGSPQGQPGPSGQPLFGPSGQPARPASTAVPPSGPAQVPRPASTAVPPSAPAYRDSAPAYREGLQVHVHDHPPDGTFEKIKRRLEQESMARMQGRPAHFINPAHVWSENGPNRLP